MLSEGLFAAIYSLATQPGAFEALGAEVARDLGYRYGLIALRQNGVPQELSLNQPDDVTSAYAEHYFRLDPWTGLAASTPLGELIALPDDHNFYDTEFYVDFARPMGVVDPVGVRLPLPGGDLIVGINQPLQSARPTAADGITLQEVGRHLQRALQLRNAFAGITQDRDALLGALHRVAFGLVIASADGRIHALNAAAESAIQAGCGLLARGGVLKVVEPAKAGAFAMLMRDVSDGGPGGALRLPAGEGRWTEMLISPLPIRMDGASAGRRVLVTFRPPTGSPVPDARILMSLFSLTRVEAQVAIAIMEGHALDEIAVRRGVKPSTVKSQLDAIFAKTDTTSQRGLVRLLSALPILRDL